MIRVRSIRMFTDNPSYFSLSDERSSTAQTTLPASSRRLSAIFRRSGRRNAQIRMGAGTSQAISEPTSNVSAHRPEARGHASDASTPTEERVPMLPRNEAAHIGCVKRRSFRNLFRSVSANADYERTQKFLKGDPRPSDVAPPSPYQPHRLDADTFRSFFYLFK